MFSNVEYYFYLRTQAHNTKLFSSCQKSDHQKSGWSFIHPLFVFHFEGLFLLTNLVDICDGDDPVYNENGYKVSLVFF